MDLVVEAYAPSPLAIYFDKLRSEDNLFILLEVSA
jgi:hypothetical protein